MSYKWDQKIRYLALDPYTGIKGFEEITIKDLINDPSRAGTKDVLNAVCITLSELIEKVEKQDSSSGFTGII